MKTIVFIVPIFLNLNIFSQESLSHFSVTSGVGAIHYPTGRIFGFTNNYGLNYKFSKHFGALIHIEMGSGKKEDNSYFDFSKTTAITTDITYIPYKLNENLNINAGFTILSQKQIFGTKDVNINSKYSMSSFTSYEKFTFYCLNLGLQVPVIKFNKINLAMKADVWASWLQINAYSLKLQLIYNFKNEKKNEL